MLLKEHERPDQLACHVEGSRRRPARPGGGAQACFEHLATGYEDYLDLEDVWHEFHFPVSQYPDKVAPNSTRHLALKGRCWASKASRLFDGEVWNVRSHAGYRVAIEFDQFSEGSGEFAMWSNPMSVMRRFQNASFPRPCA